MDSSNNPESPQAHKYNTRFKKGTVRKYYTNENIDTDSESELNIYEYRKFLSNLFPSQHMNKKLKNTHKLEKIIKSKNNRSNNIIIPKTQKYLTIEVNNKRDDDDYVDEEESEDEEYDNDDEDYVDDEYDNDDEEDDNDDDDDEESDDDEEYVNKSYNGVVGVSPTQNASRFINELVKISNQKKSRINKLTNQNKSKLTNQRVSRINKINKNNAQDQQKKQADQNVKVFKQLLMEKDNLNDLKFFKNKIELDHQEKLINELKQINDKSTVDKPYRIHLLESNIPHIFKVAALKKISIMENMDPSVGEYFKLKNWIDTFMCIPFNKFNNLPFNINDGLEKCNEYMENSIATLDSAVYGLHDAKMQIMQLIGQWIVNPEAIGSAIAIHGPMGTGKTSFVKEGISKILNRPFAFLALGGATDSSILEGHGYTYEGSTWGKIVDILIQTKCANPIIYFDELDKVSDTPKGEEIIGILTHLIDSTQNSNFHDKYFSEIDFDLSKALFIFSYNDESKVNPILLDRMYKISTKGYDLKEKKIIANNYLLPTICKQIKFERENVVISDETLDFIIEKYTEKEEGVRNLKRCLEIIYTKLNLFRLMKPESILFKEEKSLKIEFPYTVTSTITEKLIKKEEQEKNDNWKRLYT